MTRAIITVDLAFGNSGKGATVDWLCRKHNADLVIRYSGGAQQGKTVVLPDKRSHSFSQFGAGTLAGVKTFIGPSVIIKPNFAREAKVIQDTFGVNPFPMIRIHPDCVVATPYHQAMNRIRELNRLHPHGSCGIGIGEARKYWLDHGSDAIFASDLRCRKTLCSKLALIRHRMWLIVQESEFDVPEDHSFYEWGVPLIADSMIADAKECEIAEDPQPAETTIFEGGQGVLLDETYGFHPHTTWSTVTTHHAEEFAHLYDEIERYGITRAYMCRQGAGPLPTYDANFTKTVKGLFNQWQGNIRAGWLDLCLLRYSEQACGSELDGLIVNHLDELPEEPKCVDAYYDKWNDGEFLDDDSTPTLKHQQKICKLLEDSRPILAKSSERSILSKLSEIAPIYAMSYGPTHEHRKYAEKWVS